jgi:hypothetical protein
MVGHFTVDGLQLIRRNSQITLCAPPGWFKTHTNLLVLLRLAKSGTLSAPALIKAIGIVVRWHDCKPAGDSRNFQSGYSRLPSDKHTE